MINVTIGPLQGLIYVSFFTLVIKSPAHNPIPFPFWSIMQLKYCSFNRDSFPLFYFQAEGLVGVKYIKFVHATI